MPSNNLLDLLQVKPSGEEVKCGVYKLNWNEKPTFYDVECLEKVVSKGVVFRLQKSGRACLHFNEIEAFGALFGK